MSTANYCQVPASSVDQLEVFVQCLSKPCADQLKQKIRTNLKQSIVEVWGVSGNKYGRISNLKTLFDTRPGHRGDYFSYKPRDMLRHILKWMFCFYNVYLPRLESANGARPQPPWRTKYPFPPLFWRNKMKLGWDAFRMVGFWFYGLVRAIYGQKWPFSREIINLIHFWWTKHS